MFVVGKKGTKVQNWTEEVQISEAATVCTMQTNNLLRKKPTLYYKSPWLALSLGLSRPAAKNYDARFPIHMRNQVSSVPSSLPRRKWYKSGGNKVCAQKNLYAEPLESVTNDNISPSLPR